MTQIKLLLVDDHPILRAGLRMLLEAESDMVIIGEAGSGEEAVQAVRVHRPDVVVMDVAMPGMTGIEATQRIRAISPDTVVLALTMYEDEQYFFEMLNAGASGYIPKRAAPDDLIAAIHVVYQGNVFLHATLARFLVQDLAQRESSTQEPSGEELTPREQEVLGHIAEGATSRMIAERLTISPKTVDRHRENIMAKLGLHNRAELVRYAIQRGLISD